MTIPFVPYLDFEGRVKADAFISTVSMAGLTRFQSVRIWRQVLARRKVLNRIGEQMFDVFKGLGYGEHMNPEYRESFLALSDRIVAHDDFCAEVLSLLDINNAIDRPVEAGLSSHHSLSFNIPCTGCFEVNEGYPVAKAWNEYYKKFKQEDLWKFVSGFVTKQPGIADEAALQLIKTTYAARRALVMARLQWELRKRHEQGWYIIFDTLTIAPDRAEAFYADPQAIRDYFRNYGRAILRAEGRDTGESTDDCYTYFCCPEYGTRGGRLHFHCLHFCRTLPKGCCDPNAYRALKHRRVVEGLRKHWKFGFSKPIAVRYHNDAFTRKGWVWPTDGGGRAIKCTGYMAVGYYVTKYVCKNLEGYRHDAVKRMEDRTWKGSNKPLSKPVVVHARTFRIRMSRHLGNMDLDLESESMSTIVELTQLDYRVSPFALLLRRSCKRFLAKQAGMLSIGAIQQYALPPKSLLNTLRSLMKNTTEFNLQNFMSTVTPKLLEKDISDDTRAFIAKNALGQPSKEDKLSRSSSYFGAR